MMRPAAIAARLDPPCTARSQRQRERRQHPRRHQIEMTEEMHRDVRRQAEDHGRENRGAPAARRRSTVASDGSSRPARTSSPCSRKRTSRSSRFCAATIESGFSSCRRDQRRQRRVRMVRDRRPERVEEVAGVEVRQPRRREHVAHPPQVPEKAVVVARIARDRVSEVQDQRPRPADRQQPQRAPAGRRARRATAADSRDSPVRLRAPAVSLSPWPDDELAAHAPAAVLDLEVAVVGEGTGAIGAELEGDRMAGADALRDAVLVDRQAVGDVFGAAASIFTRSSWLTSIRGGSNANRRTPIANGLRGRPLVLSGDDGRSQADAQENVPEREALGRADDRIMDEAAARVWP